MVGMVTEPTCVTKISQWCNTAEISINQVHIRYNTAGRSSVAVTLRLLAGLEQRENISLWKGWTLMFKYTKYFHQRANVTQGKDHRGNMFTSHILFQPSSSICGHPFSITH